jgi:hypothetical protein
MEVKDLPLAETLSDDDLVPISQSGHLRRVARSQLLTEVTDGDKGDITVTNAGQTWTIDNGLAATVIADGSVSNTEFQYLDGVTSSLQTQINAKASSSGLATVATSGAYSDLSGTPTITTVGQDLIDDTTVAAQRATLGVVKITVSLTEPVAPSTGDLWVDLN